MKDFLEVLWEFIRELIDAYVSVVVLAAICAIPVLFLWNWLMPDIFGLARVNYLQIGGLLLLLGLIVKSFELT